MIRSGRARTMVASCGVVAVLVLSACGAGGGAAPEGGLAADAARVGNDINPVDPTQLRQGGDVVWPLTELAPNFNYHHVDGTLGATIDVTDAVFPHLLRSDETGAFTPDPDYLTSAELTGTDPQTVTYRLNPDAVWSNGRPMDRSDFDAMWRALSGADPAYQVGSTTGYDSIASVTDGATPGEVVVTFARPFADWRNLFARFYPREIMGDPTAFATALTNEVPISGGPFQVESIDRTAQRLVMVPNPTWWGAPPRLDRIIFTAMDQNAMPEAFANGSLTFFEIGGTVPYLERARAVPGTDVRVAAGPAYGSILFNGAPGAVLADPALRQAIVQGIDRSVILAAQIGPIYPDARPLGNHLFVDGVAGYQDNAVAFDAAAAARELDALGWVLPDGAAPDAVRVKDGRELVLRDVVPAGSAAGDLQSKIVTDQLGRIGVRVAVEAVPLGEFFSSYVKANNFDLTHVTWLGTPTPISSSATVYRQSTDDSGQNYGRIGNAEIDALYDRANAELDPQAQQALANEIDRAIWAAGHSLPLFQRPDAWAVPEDLANFGATGFATLEYERIGWMTP